MKAALVWMAAALPLAAQPKLLTNAQVDVRAVSGGFAGEFRKLVESSGGPAWIGYTVPAVRTAGLGCDYVRDGSAAAGVVHLEPPSEAIVLLRVEAKAVGRIRALSPYCEIDAGGLPVHWLTGVNAADSVGVLSGFATEYGPAGDGAVSALAAHADAAADAALNRFLAPEQPEFVRLRAISRWAVRGRTSLDTLKNLIATDRNQNVRRRAVSALVSLPDGAGIPVLIDLVRTSQDAALRKQAMNSLQQSRDPRALTFFEEVLKR